MLHSEFHAFARAFHAFARAFRPIARAFRDIFPSHFVGIFSSSVQCREMRAHLETLRAQMQKLRAHPVSKSKEKAPCCTGNFGMLHGEFRDVARRNPKTARASYIKVHKIAPCCTGNFGMLHGAFMDFYVGRARKCPEMRAHSGRSSLGLGR